GWEPKAASPEFAYVVASALGVGYSTLVDHMALSLRLLGREDRMRLRRARPKQLKQRLAGMDILNDLRIVDRHWRAEHLDIEVGDTVLVQYLAEADSLLEVKRDAPDRMLFEALSPGVGK